MRSGAQILHTGHTAHGQRLKVRVFGAENSMHPDHFGLNAKGFKIMGRGHQVGFRWQFVGGASPVSVGKKAQLPAVYKGLDFLLNFLEVGGSAMGIIAHVVRESRCFLGVRFQGIHHVYESQARATDRSG